MPLKASMVHSLFISDLHLCPTRPAINALFMRFLQDISPQAEALYILGDFFEYWAGDDDLADPFHAAITSALASLAARGTHLYIMFGNRDFLLGDAFMRASKATLLTEPTHIDLYGVPTLLMHGDTLCTDDVAYQAFRSMVRSAEWQRDFLSRPLTERKAQIDGLRKKSALEKSRKSEAIMDVNPEAVENVLRSHDYPRLIHGHTHRPAKHVHRVDTQPCERWVLADWYLSGSYLRCDAAGCEAHTLTSPT